MDSNDKNKEQLFKIISKSEKLIYLCGTGFSMSLGKHFYTWRNWINESKKYLDVSIQNTIDEKLTDGSTNSLIQAADIMLKELKNCNKYNDFMLSTISSVKAIHSELKEAAKLINRCGDLFATTNYDLSIEDAVGLKPITYNNSGGILNIIKNYSKNKVVHLHGAYCPELNIDDIIANSQQYEDIVNNLGAQFIQNLIGTYPIIVTGCGGTIEDPNLKDFLQFSKKYLNLKIPYFYLYCKKDSLVSIPDNFIPICYGDSYEDLPSFMHRIAMTRIRERVNIKNICRVNPYIQISHSGSAYSRMHYAARYLDFIGRKKELTKLNDFLNTDSNLSWWIVTGEGGIGKSRLVLEWLYNLPSNWFGFFLDINKIDNLQAFEPFANTVIAIDYICGKEGNCAQAISSLQYIFNNSIYKLRIVLIERHFEPNKKDWFTLIKNHLNPAEKMIFEKNVFQKGESNPIPLNLKKLIPDEEKEYINKYVNRYVKELNLPELEQKYLSNINVTVHKIHKKYKSTLGKKLQRPLFLNIFIEVWIYKSGTVSIKNTNDLLECYIEKEEKRYLERFNSDNNLLYSYMKLIALSSAIELICVNDNCLHYQEYADKFFKFLLSENQAGKKKISWTDLFVYTVPNKDNPSELFYILEPFYPDIIREFIVAYYIDENEITNFTKTARYISTMEFGMFLIRALDDFPNNKMFRQMLVIPPNEAREYFEHYLTLINCIREIEDFDLIIEQILKAPEKVTEDFGIYELGLWNRIAIMQTCKLNEGLNIALYYSRAMKFVEYLHLRFNNKNVRSYFIEIMKEWFIGLCNAHKINYADKFLNEVRLWVEKVITERNIGVCIANFSAELHYYMLALFVEENNNNKKCKSTLDFIQNYLIRFPNRADIVEWYYKALKLYIFESSFERTIETYNNIIPQIKLVYQSTKNDKFMGILATVYANICIPEVIQFRNNYEAKKIFNKYQKKLYKLYEKFSNNEEVVAAYLSVQSYFFMELNLSNTEFRLPNHLYLKSQHWRKRWSNNIDITESSARILYVKISKIITDESKNKQIINLMNELKQLYKNYEKQCVEYNCNSNEVKGYIQDLEIALKLRSAVKEVYGK